MTMKFLKPLEMNQSSSDKTEPVFVLTCEKHRNMTNMPNTVQSFTCFPLSLFSFRNFNLRNLKGNGNAAIVRPEI